jgi:hypothetical protein
VENRLANNSETYKEDWDPNVNEPETKYRHPPYTHLRLCEGCGQGEGLFPILDAPRIQLEVNEGESVDQGITGTYS